MKLHDLHPPDGSRHARTRVGRGIAAGKGKTAGRGTKGQKARTGGSIPPWFEGGQTPLHMRIPKLRGFKNRFRTDYEIVNLGDIARAIELGRLDGGEMPKAPKGKPAAPITVNQELLRDAGLVRRLDRPLKVLGGGADVTTALFVVADAISRTARSRIEAAGGSVSVLEVPTETRPAIGVDGAPRRRARPADEDADASAPQEATPETTAEAPAATAEREPRSKPKRAKKTAPSAADGTAAAQATGSAEGADEAESGSPER